MPHNLSSAWDAGARILNSAISLLPNVVLGIIALMVFLIFASIARSLVRRFVGKRKTHKNLSVLLGQVAYVLAVMLGLLISLSIVAPSFHASDLVKILGIGSVAIGFAFQNILQNFLAGILLLMQEPFELGDWISVTGLEGRVDDIKVRATIIAMENGHRAVIPNAVLFTNPVVVGSTPHSDESHQPPAQDSEAQLVHDTLFRKTDRE